MKINSLRCFQFLYNEWFLSSILWHKYIYLPLHYCNLNPKLVEGKIDHRYMATSSTMTTIAYLPMNTYIHMCAWNICIYLIWFRGIYIYNKTSWAKLEIWLLRKKSLSYYVKCYFHTIRQVLKDTCYCTSRNLFTL